MSAATPGVISGFRPNAHAVYASAEHLVHYAKRANLVTIASVGGVALADDLTFLTSSVKLPCFLYLYVSLLFSFRSIIKRGRDEWELF